MHCRYAITEPQHSLPAVAACVPGTIRRVTEEQYSEPAFREAPPRA